MLIRHPIDRSPNLFRLSHNSARHRTWSTNEKTAMAAAIGMSFKPANACWFVRMKRHGSGTVVMGRFRANALDAIGANGDWCRSA